MHFSRYIFPVVVSTLVAGAACFLQVQAQSAASLNALMKQRDAAIRQLQATAASQKADLFDKYANALDAFLKQITAKGDLESALIVKSEIESARMKRTVGTGALSALDSYRATLGKSVEGIEASTAASQSQIDAGYVRSLNQMKVDFTKAGNLDEAVAVDKEIKNVIAGTAPSTTASATPSGKAPAPAPTSPSPVAGSKGVDLEKPIVTEVTLPPGTYRKKEHVDVGTAGTMKEKQAGPPGTLHVVPNTQFETSTLSVHKGLLNADHALFKECVLVTEWLATFQASNSLFSECQMRKGGSATGGTFTTKWSFDNCVFSRGFFTSWKISDIGVKITHSTFHDIEFVPVTYRSDAGREAVQEWFTISHCKFIGCLIPEAFFIATKDCVFEDCRFVAAKDEEKLPIVTPIKLRAYVSDPTKVPPAPANCTYELLDLKSAPKDMGAELGYQRAGRTLKFQ